MAKMNLGMDVKLKNVTLSHLTYIQQTKIKKNGFYEDDDC